MGTSCSEDHYHKITLEWVDAEKECQRTYAIWQDACRRRERILLERDKAWREIKKERGVA